MTTHIKVYKIGLSQVTAHMNVYKMDDYLSYLDGTSVPLGTHKIVETPTKIFETPISGGNGRIFSFFSDTAHNPKLDKYYSTQPTSILFLLTVLMFYRLIVPLWPFIKSSIRF